MSVARPESRTEIAKPKRTTYETVKQGIKQLWPLETTTNPTNVDIVFVPGLGANPEESWKSTKSDFNWASDKNGLAKDYPNARVLLYMYESAFHGPLKVDQFLDNIAKGLLHALQSIRGDQFNRPLVFIGHSMGGLVIAKAVTMMDSQRDTFRKMFEATAGCIFFGSPFNGAQAASVAAMFSYVGEKFGQATTSRLLDLMKPGDDSLRELRGDFMRLVSKLSPKIELYCFWENHYTDIAKMASEFIAKREPTMAAGRLSAAFYDLFKQAQGPIKIVERESATFGDVVDNLGLASNHRDLVKFEDFKDPRYQTIRDPLKKIIHGAPLVAKNRLNSIRDIDLDAIKNVTKALDGASASQRRKNLLQKFAPSSWLPTESEFKDWLAKDVDPHEPGNRQRGDCLWIEGDEGRGKTGASIAALDEIEKEVKNEEHCDIGTAPILFAYYFCEASGDYSTAEELLKSLLLQLVQKQPLLVSYAKQFTKREKRRAVPTSVENLWQSLQDMLSDDSASSRVYFVLNNLHALPGESEATKKLIDLIKGEMKAMNDVEINRTSVRWMVTSRKSKKSIIDILNAGGIRLIDLEDDKYADQVQLELRKHAQQKVSILGTSKKYRKDLAYFVSSLIGNRAQNTGWIDLTCGQLEELPDTESALRVRQVLKRLPRGLDDLLDQGWRQIFEANPDHAEKIKEMLQALILTYEDPTLLELAVLAGFPADDEGTQELRELTGRCNTFLTLKGKNETKVSFKHVIVKPHLLRHANQLLGVSEEEIKWLHGELALRSFSHLIERFDVPEPEQQPAKTAEGSAADEAGDAQQNEEQNDEQDENRVEEEDASSKSSNSDDGNEDGKEENSDTESEDTTSEASESEVTALPYMVKHWLHHASKATTEMADDLSREEEFWKPGSSIRRRWLMQYDALTYAFNEFDEKSFAALHVAASIGFRQLVVALLRNGYENELDLCDNQDNTPLHFAAFFGRPNIVEELLSRGVNIDGGKDEGNATPVFMAAYTGSVRVLKMLLTAGADPNAADKGLGTPLNAAINSGNLDAVKILVAKGVSLSLSSDSEHETALSCAARLPDSAMFDYIIETGADVLSPHDYNTAFIASAYQGTVDIFRKLLEYEHDQETLQEALVQATDECEWDIVRIILRMYPGLDCNKLFEAVATGYDNEDELLNIIWEYADGSISANTLNDAIYLATDNEKESTVKYLLETCKASPNAVGDYYGNALTAAAYDGTLDMVKMLLDSGADIKSPNGWALQTAAGEGHEEVVKELLARGADVNAHSDNPNFPQGTALQAACEAGRKDIAKLLLENKADPNVGGGDYTCPIIAAARKGEADILELLVEYKAKVDVFGGPDSSTPLINAAMFLPTKYLKLLLDAGANINLADPDGDTALIMTSLRGDSESVEFLLKNGADAMAVSKTRKINALQAAFQGEDRRCLELVIDHVSEMLQKKGDVKSSDEPEDNDDADSEATGAGIEHSENEASGDEDSHAVSDEETEETDGSDEEGDE